MFLNLHIARAEEVADAFKAKVDELSKLWGVDITKAEIQDIALPEDMKRALAVKAEADREAQAVVIKADAGLKASNIFKQAADNMKDPNAMQLRILAAVSEASARWGRVLFQTQIILCVPTRIAVKAETQELFQRGTHVFG